MRCTLYGFITDYVKDIFVEEILFDIREKLSEVTQGTVQFIACFQYSSLDGRNLVWYA